jgi:hypothetical protein
MEEAVLRPPRRHTRSLLCMFVVVVSLGLIWPAGLSAARSTSTAGASSPAARSERTPTVRGQGAKPLDAGRGNGPAKPLEKLNVEASSRKSASAPATRNLAAPAGVVPAPVLVTGSGAPAATSFDPWEGINETGSGLEPPDPWVAVGPDDVVQTVQNRLRFTNREGTLTAADLGIFEFFDLGDFDIEGTPVTIDGVSDPRWLYDAKHNRWIGITTGWHCDDDGAGDGDDSMGFVFGAISQSPDPTDGYYHFYEIYPPGFFPYEPAIGTSGDKFTIGVNENLLTDDASNCTTGTFDAGSVTSFDWTDMLGSPALPDFTYDFDLEMYAPRPAVSPQGVSNTIFVVSEQVIPSPTQSNVSYRRITGPGGAAIMSPPQDLTSLGIVAAFEDPPRPIQPATSVFPVGTVDRRPTDAIWQDNVLTFASTFPCDPAGGNVGENRDCARVTQLDTSTATPSLVQDMLIGTTGNDTWYPGIGQSQSGILHVVYTRSSATEGMSSFDRYQLPSDSVNEMSAAREIANGGAVHYAGTEWGHYVGVAQDPRDTNAVWQGNQYTKSDGTWGTRVSELQTAGSTFVGIAPVRLLDSRFNIGTVGPFTSSVPKSVDIAGRGGIPSDAVAITGNLTIVGQQQAGYASLTPLPNPNPATSTLNFPLGDNRANNVTSPLSNAGGVSITYKAGAGKQTHFILDVTGYFLNDDSGQTYNDLTPLRVLDTRSDIGLTNAFQANTNRQFQVAGVGAIPANAKAITGNLTVVNQTGAGYVTLATNAPPGTPATSTINFPAGDTRANGVTIKLSAAGTLWAVYKAPNGRTTHLILDVTGYYLDNLNGARFVAVTPGRRMDTRFPAPQEGLTNPFSANNARTLVIEPYQGVPANATAITGNLTVVGQTRAGYVSMTPLADDTPDTSTLNFPLGDVRANGVTGPLGGAGSVGLVYKSSGGLTHLILDITGYFR